LQFRQALWHTLHHFAQSLQRRAAPGRPRAEPLGQGLRQEFIEELLLPLPGGLPLSIDVALP
jgi:hypothetical protein